MGKVLELIKKAVKRFVEKCNDDCENCLLEKYNKYTKCMFELYESVCHPLKEIQEVLMKELS